MALTVGSIAWFAAFGSSCQRRGQPNQPAAQAHAQAVVAQAAEVLSSLRARVPQQTARLTKHWGSGADLINDPGATRSELAIVAGSRSKTQFDSPAYFAIARNGVVVRNDQPVDELAGTDLYRYFPQLRTESLQYRETVGNFEGVTDARSQADRQWVGMADLGNGGETVRISLVAGVSLSLLAQQLEKTLRTAVRRARVEDSLDNMPLLYCFLVTGSGVYTGPLTPSIHARTLLAMHLVEKVGAGTGHVDTIEVEQRPFALAVEPFTALAPNAAIVILRSET